ncbi:ABC transporter ATP-binding protein [Mesorhizobium sp. 10J20-29]
MQGAVELRGVVKRFNTFTALRRMDLTIRQGEFFTMLGASGCGKTTTLRLIAGFELPTEGHILIDGQDVSDVPAHLRPVHTVFQSYALFPHLSILDNVSFPLTVRRVPRRQRLERARAALDLVQMGGFPDRKPSQLSGGQQQRVALARALVNEPKVLLLDEPLGALDLKLRKEMQHELKQMQRRLGITFVFVTHDQEEALTMSDRIALMRGGEIIQLDTPSGLYNAPSSLYAAEFIGETNMIPGRVIEAGAGRARVEALGGRFDVACSEPPAAGAAVTLTIRPERVTPVAADASNSAGGRLVDVDFIGTDLRLVYTMSDGTRVTLRRQNTGAAPPQVGQGAQLGLAADDLRLFVT